MTQVADKVLSWLYNVLQDYQHPQRTYSDAARTLSTFPSLSPRTEVYTYQDGRPALLLTLSGTLPIDFRGTVYHFPVKTWVPQAYPYDAPMVYVTPGNDMLVRPGQHVGVDGRVYHPYLRDWDKMGDRASIIECLDFVQQVFAKEPPVISKAHQLQYQQRAHTQQRINAGPPQLPPKRRSGSSDPIEIRATSGPAPPPKPPKPHDQQRVAPPVSPDISQTGPPLPPLPYNGPVAQRPTSYGRSTDGSQMHTPVHQNGRVETAATTAAQYSQQMPPQRHLVLRAQSPVSPVSPLARVGEQPQMVYAQTVSPSYQQPTNMYHAQIHQPMGASALHSQAPGRFQDPAPLTASSQHSSRKPGLPLDLLSDPFDISISERFTQGPPAAPPIPPNPEKEHLLHALSVSLVSQAQQKVAQNLSRLAPLQAQEHALNAAHARLDSEMQQLEHLSKLLDSNEAILRRSVQDCETTIESAQSKPQPAIDEVLMATTLVAQQLWKLSAEEAGCREATYVLQKSLDQGRISGEVFVRQMRSLGRERFLKMVLVRKCAKGLGLEMRGR